MCKRKNSVTMQAQQQQHSSNTPKRARWVRLSFSKSPSQHPSSGSASNHSSTSPPSPFPAPASFSTHLHAKADPVSLVDHQAQHPHRQRGHSINNINKHLSHAPAASAMQNSKAQEGGQPGYHPQHHPFQHHQPLRASSEESDLSLDEEEDTMMHSYPSTPSSSRRSSIDDGHSEAAAEQAQLVLFPSLFYQAFNKLAIPDPALPSPTSSSSGSNLPQDHQDHQFQPQSSQPTPPFTPPRHASHAEQTSPQNQLWQEKSESPAAALTSSPLPNLLAMAPADGVQMWVCCACENDNAGDTVWCRNKGCSHYTVNCLDCFSY